MLIEHFPTNQNLSSWYQLNWLLYIKLQKYLLFVLCVCVHPVRSDMFLFLNKSSSHFPGENYFCWIGTSRNRAAAMGESQSLKDTNFPYVCLNHLRLEILLWNYKLYNSLCVIINANICIMVWFPLSVL